MAMNFPDSPSVDDTFTVGDQTWKWTGTTWDTVPLTEYSPSPHAATHELGGSDPLELDPTQVTGLDELNTGTAGYTALSNGTAGLSYQPVSHNYIINGAFDFWQRGDGPYTADGYTADRFHVDNFDGSLTKQTFTPAEIEAVGFGDAKYFARFDSPGGTPFSRLEHRIEDVRTLAGQTVTFSFWAKADTARNFQTVYRQNFAGGQPQNTVLIATQEIGTSWQRYAFTTTLDDISGATINEGSFLQVEIREDSDVAYTLDTWGWQLEAGSIATPFKRHAPSLGLEEESANRYYQQNTVPAGTVGVFSPYGAAFSSTGALIPFPLKTNLYDSPTEINFANLKLSDGISAFAVTALTIWNRSNRGQSYFVATVASGLTVNRPYFLEKAVTANEAKLGIGREL